jgi:hypothetical protein
MLAGATETRLSAREMTSVIRVYAFWTPLAILSLDSRFEEKTQTRITESAPLVPHASSQFQDDEPQVSCQEFVLRDKSRIAQSGAHHLGAAQVRVANDQMRPFGIRTRSLVGRSA